MQHVTIAVTLCCCGRAMKDEQFLGARNLSFLLKIADFPIRDQEQCRGLGRSAGSELTQLKSWDKFDS